MELTPADRSHLVDAYRSGLSCQQVADRFGVHRDTVNLWVTRAGVMRSKSEEVALRYATASAEQREAWRANATRAFAKRRLRLPVKELVRRYQAGESEKAIADAFGCARSAIRPRLIKAGVKIRSQSEAEALKWHQMSSAARKRQVAAAHRATRGRRHTLAEKVLRANTVQAKGLHRSPAEDALADMLRARGVETVAQQAIGPYNCDLGAAPVAVEVFGGEWHWNGRHLLRTPRRFRYIMKAGWHLLIVHVTPRRFPLTEATADHVAAYVKRMRRQPAARREYRVIRTTGELEAAGSVDDEKIAIIPALTLGRDATTGRYKSVARQAVRV